LRTCVNHYAITITALHLTFRYFNELLKYELFFNDIMLLGSLSLVHSADTWNRLDEFLVKICTVALWLSRADVKSGEQMQNKSASLTVRILDALESPFVGIALVMCRPSFLVRFIAEGWRLGFRISVLNRVGLLSSYMRAQIDRTLGHEDRCLAAVEGIVAAIEESVELPLPRSTKLVLHDLYVEVVRLYLYGGQLEDASSAMIRGCKFLGTERLHGLSGFDFKSAQIVKAAVAAGKMLTEGSTATFMVKAGSREETPDTKSKRKLRSVPKIALDKPSPVISDEAKIIPFPEMPRP
jgi:hypothetical protein